MRGLKTGEFALSYGAIPVILSVAVWKWQVMKRNHLPFEMGKKVKRDFFLKSHEEAWRATI